MIFVIKQKDKLVAFSHDMQRVYFYLRDFYYKNSETNEITITKVDNPIEELNFMYSSDEYELVECYPSIVLTSWEYCLVDDYLKEKYTHHKDLLIGKCMKELEEHGKNPGGVELYRYMMQRFGPRYSQLMDYDKFLNYLGTERIKSLILENVDLRKEIYELNVEYLRKIKDN